MINHNKYVQPVFEVIREYASQERPISQKQILNKLLENPDCHCNRRTVARALDKLDEEYGKNENGGWINEFVHLHYKVINRGSSPIPKDYWLEFLYEDDFTDEELMFLMDAVQFSKHVSKSNAEEITQKLLKLTHNRYSGVFSLYKNINEKNVPVNKDLFRYLGDINTAIHLQKMISFYPTEIGTDKRAHRVGDEPVKICPYRIVVADGYYYLLCGEKYSKIIRRYRVDRITGLKILDEGFVHSVSRINAAVHSHEYIAEHCYMNIGETVDVTLEIDRKILSDVIDTFGTKTKIDPAHPSMNRITVHVMSSEKDIIDWAMRYGEYAVILTPDYLVEEIQERAHLLSRAYSGRNTDIEYLEQINSAGRYGDLFLSDIDLNGQDSYRDLEGIKRAVFRRNGITDFSFLSSYDELRELTISHNAISDPGVLSELSQLRHLTLDSTGITNLDFLEGLDLTRLSIHELTIENVNSIYSLHKLRFLIVNKPVSRLIDPERFTTDDGRPVEIITDNHARRGHFLFRSTRLPREESRLRNRETETMEEFETCEVTDSAVRASLISQIDPGLFRYGRDKNFSIVDETCSGYERVELFEDLYAFAGEEYSWYVTYEGPAAERITDIDENRIFVISIFKQDHGKKLALMAVRNRSMIDNNDADFRYVREKRYSSMYAAIQYMLDNNTGWAEISGELERNFAMVATINDVINPAMLVNHNVFSDIEIEADNYHYLRKINGEKRPVKKISYGHIE